ncbi:CrcB family protein [Micromonospora sp. WMMD1120]|uniref:fluoride efflux transporter FluC n=1 Tax=Micromonospora sp. WMMD1120 TaxID=3016106 RepID=UPI0024180702|nr:CrcB family protein [Micromonospora sp. WMMD1120]MDG4810297.1 CrcB family protein [Micromonospora sp. WMMD1120]
MPEPFEPRTDPDVDLRVPADRRELTARPATLLAAIAAGGVVGALARAGLQHVAPHGPTDFPWATFGVNLSGCLLIGVLMATLGHLGGGHPLVRPFLGVGVLGGFTTFSTYAVDIQQALVNGAPGTALAGLAATVLGALVAVGLGDAVTAGLLRRATR